VICRFDEEMVFLLKIFLGFYKSKKGFNLIFISLIKFNLQKFDFEFLKRSIWNSLQFSLIPSLNYLLEHVFFETYQIWKAWLKFFFIFKSWDSWWGEAFRVNSFELKKKRIISLILHFNRYITQYILLNLHTWQRIIHILWN